MVLYEIGSATSRTLQTFLVRSDNSVLPFCFQCNDLRCHISFNPEISLSQSCCVEGDASIAEFRYTSKCSTYFWNRVKIERTLSIR